LSGPKLKAPGFAGGYLLRASTAFDDGAELFEVIADVHEVSGSSIKHWLAGGKAT
jgi:hypothetical protein